MAFTVNSAYIADQAFVHLEKAHTDLSHLDAKDMELVREAVSKTVTNYMDMLQKAEEGKAPDVCLSHLAPDHLDLIKKSLEIQTYEMSLNDRDEVEFTFQGQSLSYPAKLQWTTGEGADTAGLLQMASIIIESIVLVLNLIGIAVPSASLRSQDLIKKVIEVIQKSPILKKLIGYMVDASKDGRIKDLVQEMFKIVKVLWSQDSLMKIAKIIFSRLSWLDWILISARLTAQVVAFVFTGGAAKIAALVVNVVSAVQFLKKLTNLFVFAERSKMLNAFICTDQHIRMPVTTVSHKTCGILCK